MKKLINHGALLCCLATCAVTYSRSYKAQEEKDVTRLDKEIATLVEESAQAEKDTRKKTDSINDKLSKLYKKQESLSDRLKPYRQMKRPSESDKKKRDSLEEDMRLVGIDIGLQEEKRRNLEKSLKTIKNDLASKIAKKKKERAALALED